MSGILLAISLLVSDETLNIGLRDHTVVEDVRVVSGRLPREALEVLGIRIGRNNLLEARARLGAASLLDPAGPHDALGMCYVAPAAGATLFLETGTREFGAGETDRVDTLVLIAGASTGCGRLSAKRLSTNSGLRVGLTSRQVEEQLGVPGKRSDKLLLYVFNAPGVMGVAEVHLQRGVVWKLVIVESVELPE